MTFNFVNVFIFIILGLLMTLVIISVSRLLAPRVEDHPDKYTTYECGERPVGGAWILFNFRFYAVALAFVIFDIELILVFPCVTVFRAWLKTGAGLAALLEILFFVGVLFLGLVYMLSRGDFEWSKDLEKGIGPASVLVEHRPIGAGEGR